MATKVRSSRLTVFGEAAIWMVGGILLGYFAAEQIVPSFQQLRADPVTLQLYAASPDQRMRAYGLLAAANAVHPVPEVAVEQADLVLALRHSVSVAENFRLLADTANRLEAALQSSPAASAAWFKLALVRWQLGHVREAGRAFVIAETLDPNSMASMEQRVWLALRVWPMLSPDEIGLAKTQIRRFYADLNRWQQIFALIPDPQGEDFVRHALEHYPMPGWSRGDALHHYNVVGSRRR